MRSLEETMTGGLVDLAILHVLHLLATSMAVRLACGPRCFTGSVRLSMSDVITLQERCPMRK